MPRYTVPITVAMDVPDETVARLFVATVKTALVKYPLSLIPGLAKHNITVEVGEPELTVERLPR